MRLTTSARLIAPKLDMQTTKGSTMSKAELTPSEIRKLPKETQQRILADGAGSAIENGDYEWPHKCPNCGKDAAADYCSISCKCTHLGSRISRLESALISIAENRNDFDGPSLDFDFKEWPFDQDYVYTEDAERLYMQGYRDGQEFQAKMAREALELAQE